jgi:hypothetical protein
MRPETFGKRRQELPHVGVEQSAETGHWRDKRLKYRAVLWRRKTYSNARTAILLAMPSGNRRRESGPSLAASGGPALKATLEAWQRLFNPGRRASAAARARSRHDEAMVRHAPRPLSRARPQRLPSPVRRHRHEHETRPRAHGARMKHVGSEKHAGSKARQARRKAGQTATKGSNRSGRHENN